MSLLTDAWRRASQPLVTPPAPSPRPPLATSTQPARALNGMGPHTRVVLTGAADDRAVRLALTAAWRRHGQPLVVVLAGPDTGSVVDVAARAWVAEHACAGHVVETRWTTLASSPGVVLALDEVAR